MPAKTRASQPSSPIIELLKTRFENNLPRHSGLNWNKLESRLQQQEEKLHVLELMERTGGGPDVVGRDEATGAFIFFDCADESPKGRRSLCYDRAGLESRKEHRPKNTAIDMAAEMGVELLDEDEYRLLQSLKAIDLKTSSWLKTPPQLRKLGGALFGDNRFGRVFVYHNGAQSYYGSRGFRAKVLV